MQRRSPTLEGFRAILRRPSLGLAEISWRWSFGCAAIALLVFSFLEYLDTLPVTRGELFLLRTRQPVLISQTIARIFGGSGPRAVKAAVALGLALALVWVVAASVGRAATLKALLEYFRENGLTGNQKNYALLAECAPEIKMPEIKMRPGPLLRLNFLRVATALAATVGCLGAMLLAAAASPEKNPSPGGAVLIFLTLIMLVGIAWSAVNWFLSFASVFAMLDGHGTFSALGAAINLYRDRRGAVLAAGTWFGLAHLVAFFVATSVVAFPLAFAGLLPAGVVLGGVLLVTLLYFALVDFLHVGRLAAYLYILEGPELEPAPARGATVPPSAGPQPSEQTAIDDDELILSDLPSGLAAE